MAYDFEVRDISGNLMLSTVNRLCRSHAYYTVTLAPQASTNITIAGMANDNTWAAYLFGRTASDGQNATIVISSNNLAITSTETPATGTKTFYISVVRF